MFYKDNHAVESIWFYIDTIVYGQQIYNINN